jgi:hypothetical protein
LWVAVALLGCGRRNFDPLADGGPGAPDGSAGCGSTFCDDFDRLPPVSEGWDGMSSNNNATIKLSSMGTLVINLPADGDGAFLIKNLPAATSLVTIAFRIKYASTSPGTAEVDLVQLRWDTAAAGCASEGFFLVRDSTGPFDLQETYTGCGGNVNTALVDLANTGFHSVKMTIMLGAVPAAHIRVAIDALAPFEITAAHAIPSSTMTLSLGGAAVRDVTTPFSIEYDDLAIQVQ